ncbi:rhomboid family intramembrane serine protease [Microbulbifer sp.]|uniref:rhomboid family intramembrane serine protease n=1 Tax=Microbulbifer sp. TaxID=1908541 RepID=UPI003F377D8D
MNHWIDISEFPLDRDLTELAQFTRRYHLPLRIAEEGSRQVVSTPDPQLAEMLRPLLERWRAGEINLADIRVEPVEAAGEGETEEAASAVFLPSWPWRRTPLSLILIALCFIGWFLLREGLAGGLVIDPERIGSSGLSTLARHWAEGDYWRLWTPAMVHFSLPHALFNALGVWILGRPLEARAGTLPFAILVFVSAPVANLIQYYWSPQILFGGMSGVVYALVGSVFVLQRWQPGWRDVPPGIVGLAVAWLLLCASGLVEYVIGVGIANAAHLGGFFCGLLLAFCYCLAGGAQNFAK